ncbi:hypothetical protein LUZ61_017853 [Rhynchospora tenuis]|uniref:Serine aminopeptidase S33 domain-containing protein n=1 Tax=Rhynchospora tenuis TaxID=198213 RepID=A0AAD5Z863_9POAL|nr:hypothetical protein LUZ61_017853 [Rhynchospora tenuis]
MSSPVPSSPRFFWGDQPEEAEFYASQGVKHHRSFYQSPYGRIFTQSFHPIDRETGEDVPIKGVVFLTHGYGSDTGWLFQTTAIAYATWGYAAYLRKDPVYAELPAFLLGESMGGAATMMMYLRSPPDTYTGVILSAPLFIMPEEMKPSKLRLFLFSLLFGIAETWQAMPDNMVVRNSIRDPERLRIMRANPRQYTGTFRVGTMRELARICEYLQGCFTTVTVPFLAVHGTIDGITAPEGWKMLYEKAQSKDKRLILYEGFYHSLIQGESEENSKRVLADMREWIDERVKRYGCGITKMVKAEEIGVATISILDKQ